MPADLGPLIYSTLTWAEVRLMATAGVSRHVEGLEQQRKQKHGFAGTWDGDIEGAGAEMALAKWLDRYWSGVSKTGAADVKPFDVRQTVHEHGSLIIHPEDHDDRPFVLVTGKAPRYRIVGGLHCARDGKRQELWCDPTRKNQPAYFVRQDSGLLLPMHQLVPLVLEPTAHEPCQPLTANDIRWGVRL